MILHFCPEYPHFAPRKLRIDLTPNWGSKTRLQQFVTARCDQATDMQSFPLVDVTSGPRDDGPMTRSRASFTLRLRDDQLRDLVREVAEREHVSQNELIEQAVENEVVARGALLARDLAEASARLADLTARQSQKLVSRSIEEFGDGEARPDPLGVRPLHAPTLKGPDPSAVVSTTDATDPLGVIAAFDAGRL